MIRYSLHWIVSMNNNIQNRKIGIHAVVICACWSMLGPSLCVFLWRKKKLFLSIHLVNSYRHTLIYLLWICRYAENRHFAHTMNPPTLKMNGVVQQFHDWNQNQKVRRKKNAKSIRLMHVKIIKCDRWFSGFW